MNEPSAFTGDGREPLPERQRAVLDAIREHIRANGFAPTIRELGRAVGIASTNGVEDHLRRLERKGYIARRIGDARTITILGERSPSSQIPSPAGVDIKRTTTLRLLAMRNKLNAMAKEIDAILGELAAASQPPPEEVVGVKEIQP